LKVSLFTHTTNDADSWEIVCEQQNMWGEHVDIAYRHIVTCIYVLSFE